jgi:hypothetical protein
VSDEIEEPEQPQEPAQRSSSLSTMMPLLPALYLCLWIPIWHRLGEAHNDEGKLIALLVIAASGGVMVGLMARHYIKGDRRKKTPREIRHEKIRQLEDDLGYEPLDLSDVDHPAFRPEPKLRKEER